MICVMTQHFKLNRIVLLLVGLWPYERSKLVQIQIIFYLGILVTSVIYQFAVFLSADCTPDLVLKVFSIALFFLMFAIEYNSFRVNNQTMKWSLEQLQCICNELTDEKEIDIMKKYGNNGRRYTAMIMLFHVCNMIAIVSMPLLLYIFDIILCINDYDLSRMMQMMLPKHFVGRENYFYLIILHSGAAACVGGTVMVATQMMCVVYIKHACGMFRIASYRIEKAIAINKRESVSLKNEIIMYKEMIHAVDIHRKAIKFTVLFFSGFQQSRFILIIIAVITLSLNLYGISEAISLTNDIEECVMHLVIVGAIYIYLFILNHAGQEFMDHNDHIYSTAYNVQWYVAPFHVQKLILFLLQRGSKSVSLNFGMVFVLSLEFFATLTKASISYFTVVYSME